MSNLTYQDRSETPTSSSENESESSSAESSTSAIRRSLNAQTLSNTVPMAEHSDDSEGPELPRSKWAEYDLPVIPHRILKLRRLVFEALHSALTIIHETQPHGPVLVKPGSTGRPKEKGTAESVRLDVREPWMRLSRTIGALKAPVGVSREGGDQDQSAKCLAVLQIVIQNKIISLTEDKVYIRSLAKNEAKAIPSLLKHWTKVYQPDLSNDSLKGEEVLLSALSSAPIIILRLAHYSLLAAPRDPLDLSSLSIRPSDLDSSVIPALCEMLGLDRNGVTKLDMSQNGWKRLPNWLPFPFPHLETLDMTNNNPLTHLPFSLIRLPIEKVHVRGTQLPNPNSPFIRTDRTSQTSHSRSKDLGRRLGGPILKTSGPPSLLHMLLRLYATSLQSHHPISEISDLPPQLMDMLRETYICELCLGHQYSDEKDWNLREVERGWIVTEDEVRTAALLGRGFNDCIPTQVVRVRGRVCKPCEREYLVPV